MHRESLKLNI